MKTTSQCSRKLCDTKFREGGGLLFQKRFLKSQKYVVFCSPIITEDKGKASGNVGNSESLCNFIKGNTV